MRSTRQSRASRRLRFLIGLLIVSASIWVGTRLAQPAELEPVPLTADDFAAIPSVIRVTARPPSLFVELSSAEWSGMTEAERKTALEEIGRIADRAGYTGLHARTDDGTAGGQWFPRGGASLFERAGKRT